MAGAYVTDWILGFDHGWDSEKYGDTFESVDRPGYAAGYRQGTVQFRAAAIELDLVRSRVVDDDWQHLGWEWVRA